MTVENTLTIGQAIALVLLLFQGPAVLILLSRLIKGPTRRQPVSPQPATGDQLGTVSVIIPTLNEADRIGPCLDGITRQTYELREAIVVDSRSTDDTQVIVQQQAETDPRFRLMEDDPLPKNWVGRPWALHSGYLASSPNSRWILGIDADTQPQPGMIAAIVAAADSPERQVLVDLLTTNETFFFREQAHFDFLRDRIAPHARELPVFRVWSAACSSGEEPYSIAMTLAAAGIERREILASDISRRILDEAAQGVYQLSAAQKIPPAYLREYCWKGRDANADWFKVGKEVRRNVQFRQINLDKSLAGVGKFHMVWLRNAMIYFNDETRRQIVDRVVDQLESRGYFFCGHSETLNRITNRLKMVQPAVYRKIA